MASGKHEAHRLAAYTTLASFRRRLEMRPAGLQTNIGQRSDMNQTGIRWVRMAVPNLSETDRMPVQGLSDTCLTKTSKLA